VIVGIDHVQLAMPPSEEAAARRFYGEVLGLPEKPKPAALAARGGVWFETPAVKVHLGVEAAFRPARKAHPGLLVSDLRALTDRIRAAGFEVLEDDQAGASDHVYVHDPFGNRIELIQA
jgi:catechol 2,3-dioxygenase-like lactoylglutathione lyase family enzyme